jgi:hypothetical protein
MYTTSEQTPAPTCGVCGRKLGIGYYFTCHICSRSFCYAHIPIKCTHEPVPRARQVNQIKIPR